MFKKALVCSIAITALLATSSAFADTKDKKIALSNNYAGNSWRQSMLKSWDKVTKQAVADGIVAAADPFTTSENQVTEQAAQIQNLILQGYNAIVLNAASPDALNGVVKQACDAGIIVVSFDGIVTEPCAWRIAVDFKKMGAVQLDYLADKMKDGGNLLEIRGLAGVFVDDEIHKGIEEGAGKHQPVQDRRLRAWRLGPGSGAEGGGRHPAVAAGSQGGGDARRRRLWRGAGLQGRRPADAAHHHGQPPGRAAWWKEQKDANGYETMSVSIAPGVSTLAFWVAQMILDGKEVPKDLVVPFLQINQADLEKSLETTEKGGVANVEYTEEDAAKVVAGK